ALSDAPGINIMYSERGHLTLAHTAAAARPMRGRAEVNKHLGFRSELVFPDEIARLCPEINLADDVRYPVLAALYHPPGAIARHDAVAWGYAMEGAKFGVEIHQQTEVTAIETDGGRVTGVCTNRGPIAAGRAWTAQTG